jgi:hypothetical protein
VETLVGVDVGATGVLGTKVAVDVRTSGRRVCGTGVFVDVSVAVAVAVGVGFAQGAKLSDFSVVAVCSTRIELASERLWAMFSGPKLTVLLLAVTDMRLPGISTQ